MNVKELQQGLKMLKPFVGKSSTLPVLNNVALHWQDGVCWVSACNLREGARIPVKHKEGFSSVTVSHKVLTKLVKTLSGDVSVKVEGENPPMLTLSGGNTTVQLNGVAYSEFPLMPAVGDPVAIMSADVIAEVANRVASAAADNYERPALMCVSMEITPDDVTFVAADGFVLAKLTVPAGDRYASESERKLLVPGMVWKSLTKLGGEMVTLLAPKFSPEWPESMMPESIALSWQFDNGTEAHVMVADRAYPDYRVIVPETRKSRLCFERKPLSNALAAFKAIDTTLTEWQMVDDHMIITAKDTDTGVKLSKTISTSILGEPPKFALAYDLTLDLLKMAGGDSVWLDVNTAGSAIVIRNTADDDWLSVIMPMRMQE